MSHEFALLHNVAGDLDAKSDQISRVRKQTRETRKTREAMDQRNKRGEKFAGGRERERQWAPTLHGNLPTLVPPNFCTTQPCAPVLFLMTTSDAMIGGQQPTVNGQWLTMNGQGSNERLKESYAVTATRGVQTLKAQAKGATNGGAV